MGPAKDTTLQHLLSALYSLHYSCYFVLRQRKELVRHKALRPAEHRLAGAVSLGLLLGLHDDDYCWIWGFRARQRGGGSGGVIPANNEFDHYRLQHQPDRQHHPRNHPRQPPGELQDWPAEEDEQRKYSIAPSQSEDRVVHRQRGEDRGRVRVLEASWSHQQLARATADRVL